MERLLRQLVPNSGLVPVDQLPITYRAVATDLLTGQKAIPTTVPLFTAMRASMSVPGAFAPIEVDGRILGDGGLVSNLPVQLARELGAEVIIAVNLGTPLGGAESLGSALGIAQQMINILTEQNVQESLRALRPHDILIVPDLTGRQFLDFTALARSIAAGVDAARAQSRRLQALAVEPGVYAQFRDRLLPAASTTAFTPAVDTVVIRRRDGSVDTMPAADIVDLRPGAPLTTAALDRATRQVQQQLEVERVDAFVIGDGVLRDVVLVPVEAPFGLSRLRLGLELEANSYRENEFALAGLYRLGGLGTRGAEWRTALRLGSQTDLQTEYFQPLKFGSPWFASLGAAYRAYEFTLYSQVSFDPVARLDARSSLLTGALGRRFGDSGQLRLGWQYRRIKIDIARTTEDPVVDGRGVSLFADFTVDTLDSLGFPTRGYLLSATTELFKATVDTGGEENFYSSRYDGLLAHRVGPWAGHIYLAGQRDTFDQFPLALGGFLRLSGAPPSSVIGSEVVFARVVAAREVGSLPAGLGGAIRVGFSVESGRTSFTEQGAAAKTRYGSSVFAVADTRFGPIYLGLGSTPGIGTAVYLFLGSVLLPSGLIR